MIFDETAAREHEPAKASAVLEKDHDVEGWAASTRFDVATRRRAAVPAMAFLPLRGDLAPPILKRTRIQGPDEVVAGSALSSSGCPSRSVDLDVGGDTARRRIVGRATLPSIGIIHGARTSLGDGFVVPAAPFDEVAGTNEAGSRTAPSSSGSGRAWTRTGRGTA